MKDITQFRGIKCFRGSKLVGQFPRDSTVQVRSKRPPTDFFSAGVYWIISSKLRTVLESHGVDAEYFPVHVVDKKNDPIDGSWSCLNPTLVLDWFDRSQSRFVLEKDFATEIETIAVKDEVMDAAPLAVAEKTIPVLVAASDRLAASIIANGCTGVVFREPRDWRSPSNPIN